MRMLYKYFQDKNLFSPKNPEFNVQSQILKGLWKESVSECMNK